MMRFLVRRALRPVRARARVAQDRRQWAVALSHWETIRRFDPENLSALLQVANMQAEMGDYEEAEASFVLAGTSPSHRIRASIGLAGVAERQQNWDRALVHWGAALSHMAADRAAKAEAAALTPAGVLLHLALCNHHKGDQQGADRDLVLALSLDPKVRWEPEAVLLRNSLLGEGNAPARHGILRRGHWKYPNDQSILYELTRVAAVSGDRRSAIAYAANLAALNPDDQSIRALIQDHGLAPVPEAASR